MNKKQWSKNEIGKSIKKVELISDKYHKLSLIFYELGKSLEYEADKCNTVKEFRENIKDIDFDKLKYLTNDFIKDLNLDGVKKR